MMKINDCVAEIMNRSDKRIKARKKRITCVLSCCIAICICATVVLAYPRNDGIADAPPVASVSEGNESTASDNKESKVDNVESKEPSRNVITAHAIDNFGSEFEDVPSISEKYISPALQEQFKTQSDDVYYRTIVEILFTLEDEDEIGMLTESELSEKALELWAEYESAEAELKALKDEYMQGLTPDNIDEQAEKYKDKINKLSEKRDELYKLYKEQCKKEEYDKYYKPIYDARLEYAYSVGAENVVPLASTSDLFACMGATENAYIMELTADMINQMAERGGYAFRLAPPKRIAGYDVKISDYLTNLLEEGDENAEFHVAVVLAAYEYNDFALSRGINTNNNYNSQFIKPLEEVFPSINFKAVYGDDDYMPMEERLELFAKYQNGVVERNALTEKRIFIGDNSPGDVSEDAFGFEAKLTKAEVLALTKDGDVRVIYSMGLVNPDYISGCENE